MQDTVNGVVDLLVEFQVQGQTDARSHDLAYDGRVSRAGYAEGGTSEQAEDHDRVQDDIDDGTCTLGDHGIDRQTCGLQKTFKCHLEEQAE